MQYVERELAPDIKIPIRIGFIKPNGSPSIISLWYTDIEGKIYCATQKSAKIIQYQNCCYYGAFNSHFRWWITTRFTITIDLICFVLFFSLPVRGAAF